MARNPKPLRRLMKRHGMTSKQRRAISFNPFPLQYYILYKRKILPVDFWFWAVWFKYINKRRIKETFLPDGVRVSTVFLGMDHGFSFNDDAPPVLFETMIFGGPHADYQERYTTYADALAGHQRAIELSFEVDPTWRFL